jgi:hypothetical protein
LSAFPVTDEGEDEKLLASQHHTKIRGGQVGSDAQSAFQNVGIAGSDEAQGKRRRDIVDRKTVVPLLKTQYL